MVKKAGTLEGLPSFRSVLHMVPLLLISMTSDLMADCFFFFTLGVDPRVPQDNDIQHKDTWQSIVMLSVAYAECCLC